MKISKTRSNSNETWSLPPRWPHLERNNVQVWRADLSVSPAVLSRLRGLLSPAEREAANQFHFVVHRERFTVARACLRTIVGTYLRTDPAAVEFRLGEYGKPELAGYKEASPLKFNVAHSEDSALYAFARGRQIGVDLERIRPELKIEDIATRFFSAREVQVLERVPAHMRHRAFFNCWTRKEAFIKAKGLGLSLPLDQFDVTLAPFAPAVLLRTRFDESEALRWSLRALDLGPDYVAAIAVEGSDWQLSCWRLVGDLLNRFSLL
jgi:4'-phosphopantetheinyl transferase